MTDDDLLTPDAISRVLQALTPGVDLVVLNSEVRDADLKRTLDANFLKLTADKTYGSRDWVQFFADTANGLSFIGGTVIRRSIWLSRERKPYWGSLFIHVGVIFQAPISGVVKAIAEPLLLIRYGNAMWTARGFEIWMFKWPALIWSFEGIDPEVRRTVSQQEPWRRIKSLVVQRAIGAYGLSEYRSFIAPRIGGRVNLLYLAMAVMPGKFVNTLAALYCYFRNNRLGLFDVSRSCHSTWLSRKLGGTL